MPLESLPKMKRLPQSDITRALVRQLTSLLYIEIETNQPPPTRNNIYDLKS